MGNNAGEGLRGAFQTLNIESTQSNGEADQIKADSASVTVPPMVEIVLTARKGFGVFATEHIKRGTRILAEDALVAIAPGTTDNLEIHKELEKELPKLSTAQLNALSELHCRGDMVDPQARNIIRSRLVSNKQYHGHALDLAVEERLKIHAIFNTYSVNMGHERQWGTGVFPVYSRINHSCAPNVDNRYNAAIGKETVRAVRDIAKGEEILTSYTGVLHTYEQRASKLQRYGFQCDCEAYEGPKAIEHEARRQRLSELDEVFDILDSLEEGDSQSAILPEDAVQALMWAEERVALLKEEGLLGMRLADAYYESYRCSLSLGLTEEAIAYERKALEIKRCFDPGEAAHAEAKIRKADVQMETSERAAEENSVRNNMNRKRVQKEEEKAEKKAAKKAAKDKR